MRIFVTSLVMLLLVSGCATPTPYGPNGLRGGYSEELVGPDEWVIKVVSNIYTSPERVSNIMTLRCADLTLEKGFKYYTIVEGPIFGEDRLVTYNPGSVTATVDTIGDTTYASASATGPSKWVSGGIPKGKIRIRLSNDKGNAGIDAGKTAEIYRPFVVIKK